MRDLLAGTAEVLMEGPLLFLLGLALLLMSWLFVYGLGRRSAFREVDEARRAVRAECEVAAAARVVKLVPGQRSESD